MLTSKRFVVVDLETTGLSPRKGDRIVEIGAVRVVDGEKLDRFSTLVDPGRPIPWFAQKVHGISDAMVKGAPSVEVALKSFLSFAGTDCLVSHNARFDRGFLDHSHGTPLPHPHLDTILLSKRLFPNLSSYRLDALIDHLGLFIADRHRALGDAEATADLLLHLFALDGGSDLSACLI